MRSPATVELAIKTGLSNSSINPSGHLFCHTPPPSAGRVRNIPPRFKDVVENTVEKKFAAPKLRTRTVHLEFLRTVTSSDLCDPSHSRPRALGARPGPPVGRFGGIYECRVLMGAIVQVVREDSASKHSAARIGS